MPATRPRLSCPCLLILCLLPAAVLASCTANYRSKPGSGLEECAATDAGCTACYEIPGSNDFCQASLGQTLANYCSAANTSSLSGDDRFACLYWLLCNQSPDDFICQPGGAFVFSLFYRIPGENGGAAPRSATAPDAGETHGLPAPPAADARRHTGSQSIDWRGAAALLASGPADPSWQHLGRVPPGLLRATRRPRPGGAAMRGAAGTGAAASSGAVTELDAPGYAALPLGIAAGHDGNLWLTVPNFNGVARLTPAGAVTTFPLLTPNALPFGIAAGPDGNLWVTEEDASAIAKITPSGEVIEYPTTTAASRPIGITAGPDGNLWFAEESGNNIGKITPGGTLQEFPLPTAGAFPVGLAAGPDGNLWFTERLVGQIGRITPGGTITEFALPSSTAAPAFIAAGPDGNLWFTEAAANQVGRITPAGTVSQFPLPTAMAQPLGIAKGPDGNLWITEANANQVAKVTPEGAVTELALPAASSGPVAIASGPGGALWFAELSGGRAGKVTPGGTIGAISEFPLPFHTSGPTDIVTGPDGNLWFLEVPKSRIVRMSTAGTMTEFRIASSAPPGQTAPTSLIVGPDDNLWFADAESAPGVPQFGRVTPAGTITLFPISLPANGKAPTPVGMAAGPDGNVWFTDNGGSRVGTLSTSGTVTLYDVPGSFQNSVGPEGITVGPDGALWFTDPNNNLIFRVTTGASFSHFALPAASRPEGIVNGPDGNLWFVESGTNKIGRLTTLGSLTEFSIPTANAGATAITEGRDGNLWFTENTAGQVARITPSGTVTEFSTPTAGADPLGITAGPDGAIWFTEGVAGKVGRLSLSGGSTCVADATTLCIDQNPGDRRFKIQVSYHTSQGGGLSGSGNAIALPSLGVTEGGMFWFFGATNPEMLIKIIDGCSLNSHFWVFYAATTNVGFTVTVTDTLNGHQATYTNPDGHAAPPQQDTSALTCQGSHAAAQPAALSWTAGFATEAPTAGGADEAAPQEPDTGAFESQAGDPSAESRIAAAVPSHVDRPARVTPDDATVTFPTTAVGQTSTICEGVCYTRNTSPPGTCDGSGPEALDHDVSAPFLANHYVIGGRTPTCTGTPVTLPTSLSSGQVLWFDVNFSPTRDGTFTDTLTLGGFSFDLSGSTGHAGTACAPDATTLCIDQNPGDSRFMIQVSYHTSQGGGQSGSGEAIALSSLGVTEGGLFWFFGATNPEMLIKIIDGCSLDSHFWVFYAATTNVGFTVTVTDTLTGHQATYTNPDANAAPPKQDTSALPCP
jgi:streptogramin lyase